MKKKLLSTAFTILFCSTNITHAVVTREVDKDVHKSNFSHQKQTFGEADIRIQSLICTHLQTNDIVSLSQVNKNWNTILYAENLYDKNFRKTQHDIKEYILKKLKNSRFNTTVIAIKKSAEEFNSTYFESSIDEIPKRWQGMANYKIILDKRIDTLDRKFLATEDNIDKHVSEKFKNPSSNLYKAVVKKAAGEFNNIYYKLNFSKADELWHDPANHRKILDNLISREEFNQQGYTLRSCHNPDEIISLENSINSLSQVVSELERNNMFPHSKYIDRPLMKENDKKTTTLIAAKLVSRCRELFERPKLAFLYAENIYKYYPEILKPAQNKNIMTVVSELLNCKVDEIIHTKNDLAVDDWQFYKGKKFSSSAQVVDKDRKRFYLNPRDCYNFNGRYVSTITVLSPEVTLNIWEGTMLLDRSEPDANSKAREFRKSTASSLSLKVEKGQTIFMNPYAQFTLINKNGSPDEIAGLLNEYACDNAYSNAVQKSIPIVEL